MSTTYAVTGASGQLGRLAATGLLDRVDPGQVVLITRQPERLADFAARGASVRAGDFSRPETLTSAFAGVDRLLLISTDAVGSRLDDQVAAVAAASDAGVQHVVYTSVLRPEADNPAAVVPEHAGTEKALRDSALGWTFLRNSIYADMQLPVLQQAAASGQLVTNVGSGRLAYVTRADCADAAVAALLSETTGNVIHDITGPSAVSASDLAALASRIGGREVSVIDVDDDAYTDGLVQHAGLPRELAALLASIGTATRLGYLDTVTSAVEQLIGRPATGIADLLVAA
jgi:NAD(P)H dehydrogenase (quinone)